MTPGSEKRPLEAGNPKKHGKDASKKVIRMVSAEVYIILPSIISVKHDLQPGGSVLYPHWLREFP